jgi:hypothetical protein
MASTPAVSWIPGVPVEAVCSGSAFLRGSLQPRLGLSKTPPVIQAWQGDGGTTMSLSAWEQQALASIRDRLAGSDPELAALLSAFTWLASEEEMPDRERIPAGSRRALRRLRRARWRCSVRRLFRRLGLQRAALLVWLLTTAALIAVALSLNAVGGHGICTETAALACVDPAPGNGSGSPAHHTATDQAPRQPTARIPQAGP